MDKAEHVHQRNALDNLYGCRKMPDALPLRTIQTQLSQMRTPLMHVPPSLRLDLNLDHLLIYRIGSDRALDGDFHSPLDLY